ncbi:MAG: metallophosphoesterase family protein [Methyloceanibacter sp.]|uniref:metallophosphoesterase family protein n=1 Tax=Methyloceanibacter sp. TaxID=1965321 RepID=UPI003D6D8577
MAPRLPEGELLYAVGDIHGRTDLLANLLRQIEADAAHRDAAKRTLVFLGDYVDRGPDSRGVVDMLLTDLPEKFYTQFLKGNHEALLLDFLDDPRRLDHWLMNGGDATLASYGVDVEALIHEDAPPETWRDAFAGALPGAHLRFFESLGLVVQAGDYLFVHAGMRPGVPLEAQTETDLIWIRDAFLDSAASFGKIVVHGHTPVRAPEVRPNRIGIDTGAVFTGCLTALRLRGGERGFVQT